MEQPTKESVEDTLSTLNRDGLGALTKTEIREICRAYLTQMEDLTHVTELLKITKIVDKWGGYWQTEINGYTYNAKELFPVIREKIKALEAGDQA